MTQYTTDGQNVLVLFLRAMNDSISLSDSLYSELAALADDLDLYMQMNRQQPSPSPPPASDILNYYFSAQKEQRPLNEVKVLLVGQGGVGKTSLVNCLLDDTYREGQPKTDGILVRRWPLPVDGETVRLNIWDFGGQEIMHATHQFFLTRRSLYLLVIDARLSEQQNNLNYWLQVVHSFGKESSVLIVVNKIDDNHLELDRRGLRDKYPMVRAFVETSCKESTGIDKLHRAIVREIEDMEHIRTTWPGAWFALKDRLEQMQHDFDDLTYDAYLDLCEELGIAEDEGHRLLPIFHELGVILNYRDDPRLEETSILNPDWVTGAVYKILNDPELNQKQGILTRRYLGRILDRKRYPRSKHDLILRIMRKFELCYPLDNERDDSFLVPDLLSKQQPEFDWPFLDTCLNFHYHYPILPGSIITRLVVRMHTDIFENYVWRKGVILCYSGQDNRALVKADLETGRIVVAVMGNFETRREFLAVIRAQFEHIHRTIPDLQVTEMIPIVGYPGVFVPYEHLLVLENAGQESFIPQGMRDFVRVKPLLDGIIAPEMRGAVGIPLVIEERMRHTMLETGLFDNQAQLQNIFTNDLIAPWSDRVPSMPGVAARVQATINLLHNQYRADGQNALILLLRVLASHLDPAIATHRDLLTLADELIPILKR